MDQKRSQISVFFILGTLLLAFVLFYYVTVGIINPDTSLFHRKNLETQFDKESLDQLIEFCMENSTKVVLTELGLNGGTLNQTDLDLHSKLFNGEKFRLLCVHVQGSKYCVNRVLTLEEMENEVEEELMSIIDQCIDFQYFIDLGYVVELGDKKFDVTIGLNEVGISLNYHISLSRHGMIVNSADFYKKISHPMGLAYKLMVDILNEETTFGSFNTKKWMYENNMLFFISQFKPYPYIVYNISTYNDDNFQFRFSLQHEDSASITGQNYFEDMVYGCCYLSNECIKNTPEYICRMKGGSYDHSNRCSCENSIYNVQVQNFRNCGFRKHGESWCETGEGVGGRDKRYYCLDGKVYQENCRDFYEEICVEYRENNLDQGVCKINRWHDCAACSTKECCENTLLRDCRWLAKNYNVIEESSTRQCIPQVAPGFRFWDGAGQDICNIGTKWAKCSGWTCGREWVQQSSNFCTHLGSCGINRNFQGTVTTSGFLITDPKYSPSPIFLNRGFILPNTKQKEILFTESISTFEMIPTMISAVLNYLDDAAARRRQVLDYSFCGLYEAPLGNSRCNQCGPDCSEFRCYSLGQDCIYSEVNGFPLCEAKTISNNEIIIGVIDEGYVYNSITIDGRQINGFELLETVGPFELIDFSIETNVPTKCKITFLPELTFTESPSIWLGEPRFSKSHNISFRLPDSLSIPLDVYNYLNITSLEEMFDLIVEANDKLKDYFDEEFIDKILLLSDFMSDKDYMTSLLRHTISGLDDNIYYVYFRCSDESGTYNINPLYLKFKIDDITPDLKSPEILLSIPNNGSFIYELPFNLSIFLDRPSECRYSEIDENYASMPYEFDCEFSPLRMSSYAGGSYLCSTLSTILSPYIRCSDNPHRIYQIPFNVIEGTQSDYNLTEYDLRTDSINIESNSVTNVNFIFEEYDLCKIGFSGFDFNLMNDLNCDRDQTNLYMNCSYNLAGGDYPGFIMCIDGINEDRNVNHESQQLIFFEDFDLFIVSYFPVYDQVIDDSVVLGLVVNKEINEHGIQCVFSYGNNEYYQLYQLGSYQYRRNIFNIDTGDYEIEFKCTDNSGNIAYASTRFIAR
ncbi:MAG: hypothetical protein ACMXYG_00500 [Candidatus Woesearchaeota archaeon]